MASTTSPLTPVGIRDVVRNLSGKKLRDEFPLDLFHEALVDPESVQMIADFAPPATIAAGFHPGGSSYLHSAARDAIIDLIAGHRAAFRQGNGRAMLDRIVACVSIDPAFLESTCLRLGLGSPTNPATALSDFLCGE